MNAATRTAVAKFDLPEDYHSEQFDDFINWINPHHKAGDWSSIPWTQVLRIVGNRRCLVLFAYDKPLHATNRGTPHATNRGNYRLLYLNTEGDLVEFDPGAIMEAAKTKSNPYPSWDKTVGAWLEANGAMTFKGRAWVDHMEMRVKNLISRWKKHYSSNLNNPEA